VQTMLTVVTQNTDYHAGVCLPVYDKLAIRNRTMLALLGGGVTVNRLPNLTRDWSAPQEGSPGTNIR